MDHDMRVGKTEALALRASSEKNGTHGSGDTDTVGIHVAGYELHRVVDCQAGCHAPAGRVDVDVDVLLRVGHLQEEHLSDDGVGNEIIDGSPDKDDAVLEEPRIDVEGAFPASVLLNDGWDEVGVARSLGGG